MRSTVRQHWILLTILAIGFVLRLAAAAYVQRRVDAAGLPGKVCLIDGDADELQAFAAEFLLDADELGHLLAAGRAPGRPEIDDQQLALPLR